MIDLKTKLIKDTSKLIQETLNKENTLNYGSLIDYQRKLFYELYELNIYDFIKQDMVNKYCKEHHSCRRELL